MEIRLSLSPHLFRLMSPEDQARYGAVSDTRKTPGPMLGGGAAAHSVDTCNQNDVLRGHLFPFVFSAVLIRPLVHRDSKPECLSSHEVRWKLTKPTWQSRLCA